MKMLMPKARIRDEINTVINTGSDQSPPGRQTVRFSCSDTDFNGKQVLWYKIRWKGGGGGGEERMLHQKKSYSNSFSLG